MHQSRILRNHEYFGENAATDRMLAGAIRWSLVVDNGMLLSLKRLIFLLSKRFLVVGLHSTIGSLRTFTA
jgi:hypothetical protein